MDSYTTSQFAHRPTVNGTFDSICRECFMTVAANKTEDELEVAEDRHRCNQSLVDRFHAIGREMEG